MKLFAIHDGAEAAAKGELPEGALPSHVLVDDKGDAHELHAKVKCTLNGTETAVSSLGQGDEIELTVDNNLVTEIKATSAAR